MNPTEIDGVTYDKTDYTARGRVLVSRWADTADSDSKIGAALSAKLGERCTWKRETEWVKRESGELAAWFRAVV